VQRRGYRVLQLEVFVRKLLAVNALTACAVELREITALDHEVFYDAMEYAAAVAARELSICSGGTARRTRSLSLPCTARENFQQSVAHEAAEAQIFVCRISARDAHLKPRDHLWDVAAEESDGHAARGSAANADVKENLPGEIRKRADIMPHVRNRS
jgi:hypothetical protein